MGATIADGCYVFVHPGATGCDDTAAGCASNSMLTLLVGNTPNAVCAADAGSAESPPHAARVGARGGHFGAFFSQVKDVASKVRTDARFAAVAVTCFCQAFLIISHQPHAYVEYVCTANVPCASHTHVEHAACKTCT